MTEKLLNPEVQPRKIAKAISTYRGAYDGLLSEYNSHMAERGIAHQTLSKQSSAIRDLIEYLISKGVKPENVDNKVLGKYLSERDFSVGVVNKRIRSFLEDSTGFFPFLRRVQRMEVDLDLSIEGTITETSIPIEKVIRPDLVDHTEYESLLEYFTREHQNPRHTRTNPEYTIKRDSIMLMFLYESGAKQGEIEGLNIRDLEITLEPSTFSPGYQQVSQVNILLGPKGQKRGFSFAPSTHLLDDLLQGYLPHVRRLTGEKLLKLSPLFRGSDQPMERINSRDFRKRANRHFNDAGLENLTLEGLRLSGIRNLHSQKSNEELADLLGIGIKEIPKIRMQISS